jgi:glycosyltransferase involved in cell wall biosynthesis
MPMYEWYPREKMGAFDLYLCPSELDHEYFGGQLFPPPVDPETWKERTKAIRFLHNAGNVGYLENKGTRELLEAMLYVQSDATLTVRCQDQDTFAKIVEQIPDVAECNKIDWALGEIDYEDLFAEHDVYVAPERFNGLSMPLREAYAAGMMVMTTDRFPHNAWLPVEPLIPVSHYRRSCIAQRLLPFRFAVVDPHKIAECVDAWHGRDIAEFSHRGREWAEANSWNVKKPILLDLLENA